MIDIATGIFIGVFTSILAGLFLMWKGQFLLSHLQSLPGSFFKKIVLEASLKSLQEYPFFSTYIFFYTLILVPVFLYSCLNIILFVSLIGGQVELQDVVKASDFLIEFGMSETLVAYLILFTGIFGLLLVGSIFRLMLVEALVPLACKEFSTIRALVEKCSTRKQFIRYVEAECSVKSRSDLIDLLNDAQSIITEADLEIINRMIKRISGSPVNPSGKEPIGE